MKFTRFLAPCSRALLDSRVTIRASCCPHCRFGGALIAHGYLRGHAAASLDLMALCRDCGVRQVVFVSSSAVEQQQCCFLRDSPRFSRFINVREAFSTLFFQCGHASILGPTAKAAPNPGGTPLPERCRLHPASAFAIDSANGY
jgi:hypothetical protein